MATLPRTFLYVDGFNLYYGAARKTPFKWVNVIALAEAVMPWIAIAQARYFTAMVENSPTNPAQKERQRAYVRALETLPNLTVHLGKYQHSKVWMPEVVSPGDPSRMVKVHKIEEKGSDVNLATYMLIDAFQDACDEQVIITNDSDLAEPVRFVNTHLGKRVFVLNPHSADTAARNNRSTPTASVELRRAAHRVKDIRSKGANCHMALAQFPNSLIDRDGRTITKPTAW